MTASRRASVLSEEERAAIRADALALPPLTDEQIDALADVLVEIRLRGKGEGRTNNA